MTREQQKAHNAENYPASVLKWLNEATDRACDDFTEELQDKNMIIDSLIDEKNEMEEDLDDFESQTCDNCQHKPKANENYLDPCGECSRFYSDYFKPKLN